MLSIRFLTKVYRTKGGEDVKALDNVSIDFPETGMVFLLGKSGSGKSTLLNLIGGLDVPTSGEVILKGRSSRDFNQSDFDSYRNTYIGFVFQEYNILNEFNVEQNIALALELQHKKVNKEAIENLLAQVDLQEFAKRKPMTLSGGQKQRIAIARALIKEPKIILADEPTGALDSKTGAQVFDTLKKLSRDKLVIVVSHDRDFAETYADRIIELKDGRILTDETKYYREPLRVSDNVVIIGNNAVKIKNPKALTPAEMQVVFDGLKNTDGEVMITSGDNAEKAMKVARISPNGESEAFKQTEQIVTKQYNPQETRFIRSTMPMDKSIKMGLSSLKTKPIRLIFTILLAVVSFTMFGVVSSLMLYNPTYTYSEAISQSDYIAERIEKYIDGTEYYKYYVNGELSSSNKYENHKQTYFGVNELASVNTNNNGLKFVGLVDIDNKSVTPSFTITKNQEYYSAFDIKYLTDCDISGVNTLGYQIEGNYPNTDSEIALPLPFYYMMKDNVVGINDFSDAIGTTIEIGGKTYTVTGFIKTEEIPTKYDKLKDGENISDLEKRSLIQDLSEYLKNSFNHVGFVTPAGIANYVTLDKFSTWLSSYGRKGLSIQSSMPSEINNETWCSVYTDETYNNNKSSFNLYTLQNAPMQELNLADNEILIGKDQLSELYRPIADSFYSILSMYTEQYSDFSIANMMPTFKAYYASHASLIDDMKSTLQNSWKISYQDLRTAEVKIAEYKNEYVKARKIYDYIGMYQNSNAYNSLDSSTKEAFNKITNGTFNSSDIDTVYNYMQEHFDNDVPNAIVSDLFNNTYYYWDAQQLIDNDASLSSIHNTTTMYQGYLYLTSEDVAMIKNFITNYVNNGGNYNWGFSGWTFATIDYKTSIASSLNDTYYYRNYLGQTGTLKIKGYYTLGSSSWNVLIKKSKVDSISLVADNYSENYFETSYQDISDKRYDYLISKTSYNQDQIALMTRTSNGYSYKMTNKIYTEVSYIASMIAQLKQIFFWIGISMGAFAALMLLNFISVSISSKRKEIGVLRAIGARTGDVFKIFFSESLFIGIICFLLASIATGVVDFFMNRSFAGQIGLKVLQFGLINIGLILVISVCITFLATFFPVLHASKKPPVESIRAL